MAIYVTCDVHGGAEYGSPPGAQATTHKLRLPGWFLGQISLETSRETEFGMTKEPVPNDMVPVGARYSRGIWASSVSATWFCSCVPSSSRSSSGMSMR